MKREYFCDIALSPLSAEYYSKRRCFMGGTCKTLCLDFYKNLKKPSAAVCDLRSSLLPRSFVPMSKLMHKDRAINGFASETPTASEEKH